jgi:hypothetical protein
MNRVSNQPLYNTSPVKQTNTSSSGYSGKSIIGIVILVIVLCALFGACYWLYQYYTNTSFQIISEVEVMGDVKDAASKFSIGNGSIPSSNYSNEYSISMWVNIDNYTYNYGQEKYILCRGTPGSGNPEILLDAKTNDLIVRIKLQVPTSTTSNQVSNSSLSKFANVQSIPPQTHEFRANDASDNTYIHGAFPPTGQKTITNMLNSLGSNVVDYSTIQYQIATGYNNAIANPKSNDVDAITIMVEKTARMKEGFNSDLSSIILGNDNLAKLSDNSAPKESQIFSNEYFTAISGNEVPMNGTMQSNIVAIEKVRESFDSVNDIANACANVLLDICNISNALQSQSNADKLVVVISHAFQKMIDSLEASKANAKTTEDIDATFSTAIGLPFTDTSGMFDDLIKKLNADVDTLKSLASTTANVNMSTIQDAVNAKLTTANCPLSLSGSNDINITTNLYESLIALIKKSLYTYINNMSYGIQKEFPELVAKQSASCLLNQATNKDPSVGTCIYRSIPLQRWVNVIVSVYNQVVDIFIDGKLASSCVLSAFPSISTSDIVLTPNGGFAGKLSRVTFSNTAMTIQHARDLYYKGPVVTNSLWSMIPNWVWYTIIFTIIIVIGYSLFM